jgi:hypothetical protein
MSICSTSTIETDTSISVISSFDRKKKRQFKFLNYDPITRKMDKRLISFFVLLEISSYMTRISMGMYLKSNYFFY